MTTPVDFSTAKLLKEKGFDIPTIDCYNLNGLLFSNGWCEYIADDFEFNGLIYPDKLKEKDVLAPTIAEVVMWMYEKHGVWISVSVIPFENHFLFEYSIGNYKECLKQNGVFDLPTEAYEAAIEYCLTNFI